MEGKLYFWDSEHKFGCILDKKGKSYYFYSEDLYLQDFEAFMAKGYKHTSTAKILFEPYIEYVGEHEVSRSGPITIK